MSNEIAVNPDGSRFEVYEDTAGEWRWRLKAGNHEVVASSEGYISKEGAIQSAEQMQGWVGNATIVGVD